MPLRFLIRQEPTRLYYFQRLTIIKKKLSYLRESSSALEMVPDPLESKPAL